jgi:hypothetical protein
MEKKLKEFTSKSLFFILIGPNLSAQAQFVSQLHSPRFHVLLQHSFDPVFQSDRLNSFSPASKIIPSNKDLFTLLKPLNQKIHSHFNETTIYAE